jgi:hypothetical protein
MSAALFGHTPISGLRLLSGVKRKLDFELRRAASGAKLPVAGMSVPGAKRACRLSIWTSQFDPTRKFALAENQPAML